MGRRRRGMARGNRMSGLFGSSIVDMALGLFVLYWLLSIICSSMWEMIAALLKLRAADLERGIANLVCDPRVFHAVMAHPAITAIGNTDAETTLVQKLAGSQGVAGRPSYVSARAFSLAFLDAIAPVQDHSNGLGAVRTYARDLIGAADVAVAVLSAPGAPTPAVADAKPLQPGEALVRVQTRLEKALEDSINGVPSSKAKTSVVAKLNAAGDSLAEALREGLKAPSWHPVRRAVVDAIDANTGCELYRWASGMPEKDPLRRAILGSIEGKQRLGRFLLNITERELGPGEREKLDAAQHDLSALRTRIETWFNESMEHVSGVYKRRSKTWIFLLALLVTLPAGADSIRFASTLYASPTLRDVLVREAEQAVATPTPVATPAPAGAGTPAVAAVGTPGAATRLTAGQAAKELAGVSQLFGFADHPDLLAPEPPGAWDWILWGASRILGSLLTAFAISLGAPFWFDVLGKIVNLRSAGKGTSSTSTPAAPAETTPGRSSQPA